MHATKLTLLAKIGLLLPAMVIHADSNLTAQTVASPPPFHVSSQYHHASTAAEGWLRGRAAVIDATGRAQYFASLAHINHREAVRRAINNRSDYWQTLFDNIEMVHDRRAKLLGRYRDDGRWLNSIEAGFPKQLPRHQFDPETGKIRWPRILRRPEFDFCRDRIETALVGTSPQDRQDEELLAVLREALDEMDAYLAPLVATTLRRQVVGGCRFLESLRFDLLRRHRWEQQRTELLVSDAG